MMGVQFGKGEVTPPRLDGSARPGDGEIVLGASTLDRLGKHIGDQVEVGSGRHRQSLHVTGTAVIPTFGVVHGDRTSLAVGAMVSRRTMQMAAGERRDQRDAGALGAILVRFKPGVDHQQANDRLEGLSGDIDPDQSLEVLDVPKRPADIVNFGTMGSAPTVLAVLLGIMAIGALANTLVASVRRRRRDLALLKALGFAAGGCRPPWMAGDGDHGPGRTARRTHRHRPRAVAVAGLRPVGGRGADADRAGPRARARRAGDARPGQPGGRGARSGGRQHKGRGRSCGAE